MGEWGGQWEGEQQAQGFIQPAAAVGEEASPAGAALGASVEHVCHSCPPQGPASRGRHSPHPSSDA